MATLPDSLQSKIDPAGLNARQIELIHTLYELDQAHLFAGWAPAGTLEERKRAFLDQVLRVHDSYPGGIGGYIRKARQLLAEDAEGGASAGIRQLEKPASVDLSQHDSTYHAMEQRGLANGHSVAFVLVAGGLGERLGYDGIKMEIPVEIITHTSYMQLYCELIQALEERAKRARGGESVSVPFFIMTSGGTRSRTVSFLKANAWFGLNPSQVHVFEQHLVPALDNREGHLTLENPYSLALKPNGHGDIHALLHEQGFARAIKDMGKTHLVFIQDTNAQIVDLILPALGVSLARDDAFNFVCVPRFPEEPLGAVVRLRDERGSRTVAVEYNQLDQFLRDYEGTGDQAEADGYSAYPGSINLLVVKLDPYLEVLERTGGAVAEFINPKYADGSKTSFAKPARVETLMQDLAGSYADGANIGVTLFDRDWALAALKNNLWTAMEKARVRQPTYSAPEAESGFYRNGRIKAQAAGVRCESPETIHYHGIPFERGARVVLSRAFSLTLTDAAPRLKNVRLSRDATLVIQGEDVFLEDVRLEQRSSLVLRVCPGARVRVQGLTLTADGFTFRQLSAEELQQPGVSPLLKMRGYVRQSAQPLVINIRTPGNYIVGSDGVCRSVTD